MISLGKQIVAEFYSCSSPKLDDTAAIEELMVEATNKAGATVISSSFHHFSPAGVSGVVVIQESHLAIHTWPEFKFAAIDLFTCGNEVNPWTAFDFLNEQLQAGRIETHELQRGVKERVAPETSAAHIASQRNHLKEDIASRSIWFTNKDENLALSLRLKGQTLFDRTSPYQRTRVFDTFGFGKVLAIDNKIVCTERDEAYYHEMISHPAVLAHGKVKKVLIIGGGDGGTAREVLKHSVEQVTLVEIDRNVVDASQTHLSFLSDSFSDPRLNLVIEDGIKYIKQVRDNSLDLIIVDGSDPAGPSEGLFTADFYKECFKKLEQDGMLVTQGESPDFNRPVFVELNHCLKKIFGDEQVKVLLFHITTYPAGVWSFHIAHKGPQPLENIDSDTVEEFAKNNPLYFYNLRIHRAAFALPNYVSEMLTSHQAWPASGRKKDHRR